MRVLFLLLIFLFITIPSNKAEDFLYILNDGCILNLQEEAEKHFSNKNIETIKDPYGLILRFKIENIENEYECLSQETCKKLKVIDEFLSKINNPVIIEVHINETPRNKFKNLKKWEVSTLIANNIESTLLKYKKVPIQNKIHSVGFGEFFPQKNTSNNGGKYLNRVDIMILCDVNGE